MALDYMTETKKFFDPNNIFCQNTYYLSEDEKKYDMQPFKINH